NGTPYAVGNKALVAEMRVALGSAEPAYDRLSRDGKTVIFIADNNRVLGLIALADEVKPESKETVRKLHTLGLKVAMLTGDNERVAAAVARKLNIDTYFAE